MKKFRLDLFATQDALDDVGGTLDNLTTDEWRALTRAAAASPNAHYFEVLLSIAAALEDISTELSNISEKLRE